MYTLKLTRECISDCSHQGACDDDVSAWVLDPRVKAQLDRIPSDVITGYLKSLGGWELGELGDTDTNRERLLWVAACDAKEAIHNREQCPCTVYICQ